MWHSCDTVVRLDRKTSLHKHWRNSANQKYQTSKPKMKEPCSHAVSKKPFSIQISRICLRIHIRISTRTRRADSNTVHNQGIPSQPSWVIGFPILWVIITANTLWYTKKNYGKSSLFIDQSTSINEKKWPCSIANGQITRGSLVLNQQLVSWMAQLVGPAQRRRPESARRLGTRRRGHPSKCVQRNNDRRQPLFMCILNIYIYTYAYSAH